MDKRIFSLAVLMIVLGIVLAGCATQPNQDPNAPNNGNNQNPIDNGNVYAAEGVADMPAHADDSLATPESVQSVVNANNRFAFELYKEVGSNGGNVFFSPYSISTAVDMAYEGAKGQTAEEIQKVFHFSDNADERHAGTAAIYNSLNQQDKNYALNTANALWVQEDFPLLKSYTDAVENYLGGIAVELDFKNETEKSRNTINAWVEKQTKDKIKELIGPGALSTATRLVLTNAVYFKGAWTEQFDPDLTEKKDFRASDSETVQADMMRFGSTKHFQYGENDDLQLLELPYQGDDLSMLVLLPKNNDLAKVESELSADSLKEWKDSMSYEKVVASMPKFKLEETYDSMGNTLAGMGMPTAFSDGADFSGIAGKRLYISKVIHKSFVQVNESGTEAAAATAIVMTISSYNPNVEPPKEFIADHPFVFIIQENSTGNILFIGRLERPE